METSSLSDGHLLQIVDTALADVARRSGSHLACRPGCSQCCTGAFIINALDVQRLRDGFAALQQGDPARAQKLKARIASSLAENKDHFPGDAGTGLLGCTEEQQLLFAEFANEEVCPVLDPATQTCDLYASRPMTCRVFGPPVRTQVIVEGSVEEGLAACELCFVDATADEIAACELVADPDGVEEQLLAGSFGDGPRSGQNDRQGDKPGSSLQSEAAGTTVAFAFAGWWSRQG